MEQLVKRFEPLIVAGSFFLFRMAYFVLLRVASWEK